jgi:hypothetical protein
MLLSVSPKAQIAVSLKTYLEGPFASSIMIPYLNAAGLIPFVQPYKLGPWYYFGEESVPYLSNNAVVDWILIELRRTTGGPSTAIIDSTIARQAAFILTNGSIMGMNGNNKLQFDVIATSNLFVVIRHRNHLNIMSAYPLQMKGGIYYYDFSTGVDKVFGGMLAHNELTSGVWGQVAGDGNGNGNVDNIDKNDVWAPQSGTSGYKSGDFNMNSQVNNVDMVEYWKPNGGRSSHVPGGSPNTPPVAVMQITPSGGSLNTVFTLDGSGSHDAQTITKLLAVRWDFENDGTWDTPYSYNKISVHQYSSAGVISVKMETIDMGGLTGIAMETVNVAVNFGVWYFGDHAGIVFKETGPEYLTDGAMISSEGCSVMYDQLGEIMFYSNGSNVYDKSHSTMSNGFGLTGNVSSTQSCLIIPKPDDPDEYYIFTSDAIETGLTQGFKYSVVDMTQNSGLGAVTSKNNLLFSPSTEKVTGCRHATENAFWVIGHAWESDAFYAYLVTSTGIMAPVISQVGMVHGGNDRNAIGQMKVSPGGDKIAVAIESENLMQIFDFNAMTGQVSNPISFNTPNNERTYGVEFSPDGSKLYIDSWDPTGIFYQFDVSVGPNIGNSAVQIYASMPGGIQRSALQLGPDGKIYVARRYEQYIGVILDPNQPGTACNYVDQGVYLGGKQSLFGLPQTGCLYLQNW